MNGTSVARRLGAAIAVGGFGLLLATAQPALASGNNHTGPGDSNAGDIWVDNAGNPPGPGHEMDPHLACGTIDLWGSKLADSGGTYTIDSWPPSGSQNAVMSSTWSYNTSQGGTQLLDTFSGQTLVNDAVAAGATASNQGFHFKIQFDQDPQKHKTFWINCSPSGGVGGTGSTPTPTPTPGGGVGGTGSTPTPTPTPGGGVGGTGSTPTPTPSGGVSGSGASPSPSPSSGVGGLTTSPTPGSGVAGLTTGPSSGTAATGGGGSGPMGGVLGIVAGTPMTGAHIAISAAVALIVAGIVLLLVARRRRKGALDS